VLASLDKDKPESSWLSLALIRKWDGTMELIENYMPVGSLVGERYEVIGVLGSGGFSYVLRAHDRQEDRTVALKVLDVLGLKQGRRYDELLARFEREIELIEQLQHRNVLSIYGHGFHETPRIPYMVVEFLDGQDLGQYIREHGGFSATRLWPMLFPMLDALAMAHDRGIIHKDLSPANLFLRDPGTSKETICILDFGIAYWRSAAQRLTAQNKFLGTPRYIAPEYASRQVVSPAIDIYQMGLVLVELLVAKPVVRAKSNLAALYSHMNGNLQIPAKLVDTELWPILQKALSSEPEARHQHAREFAGELASIDPDELPELSEDDETVKISLT